MNAATLKKLTEVREALEEALGPPEQKQQKQKRKRFRKRSCQ